MRIQIQFIDKTEDSDSVYCQNWAEGSLSDIFYPQDWEFRLAYRHDWEFSVLFFSRWRSWWYSVIPHPGENRAREHPHVDDRRSSGASRGGCHQTQSCWGGNYLERGGINKVYAFFSLLFCGIVFEHNTYRILESFSHLFNSFHIPEGNPSTTLRQWKSGAAEFFCVSIRRKWLGNTVTNTTRNCARVKRVISFFEGYTERIHQSNNARIVHDRSNGLYMFSCLFLVAHLWKAAIGLRSTMKISFLAILLTTTTTGIWFLKLAVKAIGMEQWLISRN